MGVRRERVCERGGPCHRNGDTGELQRRWASVFQRDAAFTGTLSRGGETGGGRNTPTTFVRVSWLRESMRVQLCTSNGNRHGDHGLTSLGTFAEAKTREEVGFFILPPEDVRGSDLHMNPT